MRMKKGLALGALALLVAGGTAHVAVQLQGQPLVSFSSAGNGGTEPANEPQGASLIKIHQEAERYAKDGAVVRYRKMAACAKYERLRNFAQELKNDPYSWVNSEKTKALLSEESLKAIEENLAFVEAHAKACEPIPQRTE